MHSASQSAFSPHINHLAEFATWTHLHTLKLKSNYLTDTLPPQWGDVSGAASQLYKSLVELDLSDNEFEGDIPGTWSSLTSLNCVSMAGNWKMCGSVPFGLPCFKATGTSIGAHTTFPSAPFI